MKIKDIFSKLFRRPTHTENLISFAETRPAIICPAQECQLPEYIKSVDNGLDINYNIFNNLKEDDMIKKFCKYYKHFHIPLDFPLEIVI